MGMLLSPFIIPIAAFAMVVAIIAIGCASRMRETELNARWYLRARQMEHERKLKEIELDQARVELGKIRSGQPV